MTGAAIKMDSGSKYFTSKTFASNYRIPHWNRNNIVLKIMTLHLQEIRQLFRDPFTPKEEITTAIRALSLINGKGNKNLAELTIICLQNDYTDSAIECIERIFLIVKNMMANDEHGSNSNRALRELNLVGCYLQLQPNDIILNKITETIIEFDDKFEEFYKHPAGDALALDLPPWVSPPWDFDYKNLDYDLTEQIMHIDNRINFERSVVTAKIKHLKNILKNLNES